MRVGLLAILASVVPRAAVSQNDVLLPEGPWGRVELVPIAIRLPEPSPLTHYRLKDLD